MHTEIEAETRPLVYTVAAVMGSSCGLPTNSSACPPITLEVEDNSMQQLVLGAASGVMLALGLVLFLYFVRRSPQRAKKILFRLKHVLASSASPPPASPPLYLSASRPLGLSASRPLFLSLGL